MYRDTDGLLREQLSDLLSRQSKYDATSLSKELGRGKDYLRDFLAGRKRTLGSRELVRLEQLLEAPAGSLVGFFGVHEDQAEVDRRGSAARTHDRANYQPPPRFMGAATLPVYASAEGGDGSLIVDTSPLEYVPRPYIVESVPEAYAILVVGESMVPAFEPGDMAWVNPRLSPIRNTDVILYSEKQGEAKATIKRLTKWTEGAWSLTQYNPVKSFSLPRAEWQKCHRVVGKFSRR